MIIIVEVSNENIGILLVKDDIFYGGFIEFNDNFYVNISSNRS